MFIFIFLQLQTAASRSYVGSNAPTGINKDEDTSRFHTTKRGNFHEVFNLSENERPLAGTAMERLHYWNLFQKAAVNFKLDSVQCTNISL